MRIIVATDSFKGCLSSEAVNAAIAQGIASAWPEAELRTYPLADGGEGMLPALLATLGGERLSARVSDPLGRPVEAAYAVLGDGETGLVEMAEASGIERLKKSERSALLSSSYGTGELIRALLDRGLRKIIVGLGGSATNDGGAGAARALGLRLLDAAGRELEGNGASLGEVAALDASGLDPRLKECRLILATDVANPLCGEQGASRIYGPQKGADPAAVALLDENLARYAALLARTFGKDVAELPGAGAAGGLAASLMALAETERVSGAELIIRSARLEQAFEDCDLLITGEGRMDAQTAFGKGPAVLAAMAKRVRPAIAVVGLCGVLGPGAESLCAHGFDAVFPILPRLQPEEELLAEAADNLRRSAAMLARLLRQTAGA